MEAMKKLLSKTSTGTATREEKRHLKSLTSKLNRIRRDIEESSTSKTEDSLASLRAKAVTKTKELTKAMKTKDINKVIKAVCEAEAVDLAFLIDSTGSMSPHINAVKENIKAIVKQIRRTNSNLKLRLAIVAYRDLCDSNRFEVMDFNSSIEAFDSFLGRIIADGGGDGPEDIAGGLQKANGLSWNNPTCLAFLIADYPCHGQEFHVLTDDSYPSGTPGINIVEEIKTLLKKKSANGSMSLHFGKITSHTDTMIDRLINHYRIEIEVV